MIPGCVLLAVPTVSAVPHLSDASVENSGTGTGTVSATYSVKADRTVTGTNAGTLENWLASGNVANFEIQATATGDTLASGTLNSWLSLSSDRSWTLSTNHALKQTILTVSIRDASAPNTVRTTATITINVDNLG